MKDAYDCLIKDYKRHPRAWNMLVSVLACLLVFWSGEQVGETLGKALYYLTD